MVETKEKNLQVLPPLFLNKIGGGSINRHMKCKERNKLHRRLEKNSAFKIPIIGSENSSPVVQTQAAVTQEMKKKKTNPI